MRGGIVSDPGSASAGSGRDWTRSGKKLFRRSIGARFSSILIRFLMKFSESFSAWGSPKCRNINRYDNSAEKCRVKILSAFVQSFQPGENFISFFAKFSV